MKCITPAPRGSPHIEVATIGAKAKKVDQAFLRPARC